MGAVLCQSRNDVLPICFASRTLTKTESNYSTTKCEASNFRMQKLTHYSRIQSDPIHGSQKCHLFVQKFHSGWSVGKMSVSSTRI